MNDAGTSATAHRLLPWWTWVVAAGLLAHGLVPLSDYVLWDGWWYAADLPRPDGPAVMNRLFHEVGRPLDMWFYAPLRWIGGSPVAWSKCLGTGAWITAAVCVANVLRRLARLPLAVACGVGLLMATLPIFDLLGELALWMNTACVLLFWLAWVLVSRLPDLTGSLAIVARIIALATFFVSFDLNSNLVMFYAVALVIIGLRIPDFRSTTLLTWLPRGAVRHADFLVLPIVFWFWKTLFTPTSGFYATGYNQPSLAPARLATGYMSMATDFVFRGLIGFFWSPAWVLGGLLAGLLTAVVLQRRQANELIPARPTSLGLRLFGLGVFALLAAAFPYVAVNQGLATEGWLTRNCILCPLPVSMILVGLLLIANSCWSNRSPRPWLAGVIAVAVIGIGGCIHNYLIYQALGAKHWSIREKLTEVIRESSPAVIQLRDYYPMPNVIPYYPPVIWTFLANGTGEPPKTFVIETALLAPDVVQSGPDGQPRRVIPTIPFRAETVDEAITNTTMPYAQERVPRRGAQVLAAVRPGFESMQLAELGRRYILLSWFSPSGLKTFVNEFTRIEVTGLPPVQ